MDSKGRLIGGRYRLTGEIGRGGMGVVWRALDERLGREVAVKELAIPPLSTAEERTALVARAMQEARTAGALDHPNIVAVYDVVEDAGHPCIVMRLVRGYALDEVIAAAGPLPPDVTARIGLVVWDALSAAHRAGIVHRDVKPANVMVQPDGTVLLTDFSIASVLGVGTRTAAGVLLGTPGYIAPERLTHGTAGPPADLFALGATLYLAVEGVEAFDIGDALSGLFAVATAPHRPPVRAGTLGPVLDRLLAKDPAERPDASAAAEALRAVAAPDGRSLAAVLSAAPALAPVPGATAGPADGPATPGSATPGPATPGPATPGPATPGTATPGSAARGPFLPGSAPVPGAAGPAPGTAGAPDATRPPLRPTTVQHFVPGVPPPHAGAVPWAGQPAGAPPTFRDRVAALPRSAFAAAGAVLLLVIGLTAYTIASKAGGDPGVEAATDRTPGPSASASASASASPTPTVSAPPGLSAAEASLWTSLSGRGIDKRSCRSGRDPDGVDTDATLVCDTVGTLRTQVRFYRFGDSDDYTEHFGEVDDYAEDGPAHDCSTSGNEGYGDWEQRGTVACYWTDRGTWWITWGDRAALVGAEVQDTDPGAVADWWRINNAFTG